ncbi:MAG: hypothetical protein HY700_17100 [Gemmatimonadetes bacterium]|nr:hypothetical protein [Gemmatimonadota bacterium]
MRGAWCVGLLALGATVEPLAAQNSAYSVLGIGFPSAPWSVVARSMGGSIGATDSESALNPGAVGLVRVLSVQAASMQEFRRYSINGASAGGLAQTRFPYASVTAPLGPRLAYGLGFSQYAERTYDIATSDTLVLRGTPVAVSDHNRSAGGIVDIRAVLAWTKGPKLSAGLAANLIGGSSRISTTRQFSDSSYRSFDDVTDAAFSGFGVSAGVVASPSTPLRIGGSIRVDSKLDRSVAGVKLGSIDLPVTVAAGVEYRPSPFVRFAATTAWRSWSSAGADLASAATQAFNTFDTGIGVELGGGKGGFPIPLRLGFRYATLPFSPTSDQPKEIDLSAGTGLSLSGGRAQLNIAAERAMRDGGGASERAWQVTIGFHIRP